MISYLSILIFLLPNVSSQIIDFPHYCPPRSMEDCPSGQHCANGICWPGTSTCSFDPPCSAGYVCRFGICSKEDICSADWDCEPWEICVDGICTIDLPTTPRPTISPTQSSDIYCRHDNDCPPGYYCSIWLRRCTRYS
ncbi:uncharacterized protein LOC133194816 [Saccostrea echinata]|uniref:uncharacterized protein LOC133194816 n=1 Tax=Saccostrea echinata TaxID=191078 RepID=UPI002A8142BA|nr:uncharacterized protein LOC133194816 [Saccostrea echinata]